MSLNMNLTIVILKNGNDIEMYLTHNEGKSVVTERFIRTLKKKIISIWQLFQKMCILINWMIK